MVSQLQSSNFGGPVKALPREGEDKQQLSAFATEMLGGSHWTFSILELGSGRAEKRELGLLSG